MNTPTIPTPAQAVAEAIVENKKFRVQIQDIILTLRKCPRGSAERTLAFRALQQARHWLGEDLAVLNDQNPYPNGDNPANTIVDPRADVPSSGPTGGATLTVGPEDFGGQDTPHSPASASLREPLID